MMLNAAKMSIMTEMVRRSPQANFSKILAWHRGTLQSILTTINRQQIGSILQDFKTLLGYCRQMLFISMEAISLATCAACSTTMDSLILSSLVSEIEYSVIKLSLLVCRLELQSNRSIPMEVALLSAFFTSQIV